MSGRLDGLTALVTGAATGMGRAIATRFAGEGASVVCFGHGGAKLDAAAQAIGGKAVHGDVTRQADIDAALAICGGRLDIVANAAGMLMPDTPETVTNAIWEKTLAVNLTGAMMVCRAALPLLKERGGAIVNVASVGAFNASPDNAAYAASKAGLIAYTRTLAYAHGPDRVRANAVAPGWVRTPMSEKEMDDAAHANGTTREAEFSALTRRIALGRIGTPEEIAACCLFLASAEASFVTGTVLVADGGGRAPVRGRAA
ncbi:SDR family NAD(P)-dependent oxidoreductase [Nitratireductor soli]|uniref:SDR family NAD(P)-dependent oxidoreductase n=1 Tax=Nitratireductor soli TaxID=1670619 RepID=UPI00065E2A82|nr:SDR family oxidoreductase [Nitratireductor soli]